MRYLAELAPKSFRCGVVLYAGDQVVPFGENLFAVPLGALWRMPQGKPCPHPAALW